MKLAPIVLFTYNRPWHTQETINALTKNGYAKESELFIYSDCEKNETDTEKVRAVRNYLKTIQGFKKITIIEREKNIGLARNIADGVTEVVNKFGRVIVLEDDCIVSLNFLSFMNNALDFYENTKKIWHISGWNYPIEPDGLPETFLWRVMNCWGWATWADRWKHFERNPERLINEFSIDEINRFNLEGSHDFWSYIQKNIDGDISTWAIFWYATIFKQGGLCLNPTQSLVLNIGLDGSGSHCKGGDNQNPLQNTSPHIFQENLVECKECVERIKIYLDDARLSSYMRIIRKIKRRFI
jgi:hypothetical protein